MVGVNTGGIAVVVGRGGVADGSLLHEVREAHGESRLFGAAGEVHGMAGDGGVFVGSLLEPVGARPGAILDGGEHGRGKFILPVVEEASRGILGEEHLVDDFHILFGIQRGDAIGHGVLDAVIGVIGGFQLAGLSAFGGDQDDPVGGPGAVNGGGSRILEDVDRLDITGVKGVQRTSGHSVDDVKRGGIAGGAQTADVDVVAFADLAGTLGDVDPRGLALKGTQYAGSVEFFNVLALDLQGGTGDQLFLLDTITYHHHLIDPDQFLLENDGEGGSVSCDDLEGFHTHEGEDQGSFRGDIGQGENAVGIGDGSGDGSLDGHGDPGER